MVIRVIVIFLVGPLIILSAVFFAVDWMRDNFGPAELDVSAYERTQHPLYHSLATNALAAFSALPEAERARIAASLRAALVPVEQWTSRVREGDYRLLCIGENHSEATRKFLAERLLPALGIDVLMLETTPGEMAEIDAKLRIGQRYVALVGADIAAPLRAAGAGNPDLLVVGIDETATQKRRRLRDREGSRDASIATNFWAEYRTGKRHALVFGSLHCRGQGNWLYRRLLVLAPRALESRMINVRVVAEHQNGPLEAFVRFLDEIGIERRDFVIAETDGLDPRIGEWFDLLLNEMAAFRAVVVFRA